MPKKTELSREDLAMRRQLGATIRQVASARGLKPQDIAQAAGVSLAHQYRIENGEATPDAIYLFKVAALLGISVNDLFAGEQPVGTLAPDEAILLDNYRHSPPGVQAALKAASSAGRGSPGQVKKRKKAA